MLLETCKTIQTAVLRGSSNICSRTYSGSSFWLVFADELLGRNVNPRYVQSKYDEAGCRRGMGKHAYRHNLPSWTWSKKFQSPQLLALVQHLVCTGLYSLKALVRLWDLDHREGSWHIPSSKGRKAVSGSAENCIAVSGSALFGLGFDVSKVMSSDMS